MEPPHEILQEAKSTLTRIKEEEKQWAELKRLSPGRGNAVYFCVFMLIVLCASMIRHSGSLITLYSIMLLVSVPLILISRQKRRDKLFLAIIQKEAPELYLKLKDKGISTPM
jgi:formate hydrogenlyase subunit 3/multisubunit Na+/H+ antiporter MnhD subunit